MIRKEGEDWVRGSAAAQNVIVEYGDFECPNCGAAYWQVKRLWRELGQGLAIAYRHFPLVHLHPNAEVASEAAEAAGAQGQFWEMHDLLFEHQDDLEPASLVNFAGSLELDMNHFVQDLEGHRHRPRVRRDFMDGVRHGVNGTPTFFVNGERYRGPPSAEGLMRALQQGQALRGARVW